MTSHGGLHILGERDGWLCRYCSCELICYGCCLGWDVYANPEEMDKDWRWWATRGGAGVRWATRDHVLPQSLGGSDGLENLVLSCGPCNNKWGNQLKVVDGFAGVSALARRAPGKRKRTPEEELARTAEIARLIAMT